METDKGQNENEWEAFWEGFSPISEIQSWDFYGGRQWITKYVPRFGKVIEAGCGLGKYVFYLRRFGIDIIGLDFSQATIEKLNNFKSVIDPEAQFLIGNVKQLPFDDNSLSGYLSMGVIEHFIEGPQRALKEAYRVLKPGGVAIITTPNISFSQKYFRIKRYLKNILKKILKYPPGDFFQYEYSPNMLKQFLEAENFHVSRAEGCDVLYALRELIQFGNKRLLLDSFLINLANRLERTKFRGLGAQSITISIKKAPLMHCFISGELEATPDSLKIFDVPISSRYQNVPIASLFRKNKPVLFSEDYKISPEIIIPEMKVCDISGEKYLTDKVFEDFGLNINVHPKLLLDAKINMELFCKNLKPVWRSRRPRDPL